MNTKTMENTHIEVSSITNFLKESYVVITLTILGILALITAVLIAWPAIAYFASIAII